MVPVTVLQALSLQVVIPITSPTAVSQ